MSCYHVYSAERYQASLYKNYLFVGGDFHDVGCVKCRAPASFIEDRFYFRGGGAWNGPVPFCAEHVRGYVLERHEMIHEGLLPNKWTGIELLKELRWAFRAERDKLFAALPPPKRPFFALPPVA